MKPKSSQGNLTDEVVDCQQEQRQWGFALRSHRPCLKMTGYLFVIALPCDSVFSFNHALLTENKDSVNGTGLGFMVWGEALKALWSDTQSIWRSFCFAVITSQDEKWNGIRKANYKTDGLASAAEHVRYAIILGSWSKLFRGWSSLSEGNGMKVQQENVLPFTAGRAGFSKGQWSPNQWASHPASSFPSEPLSAHVWCLLAVP